MKYFNICLLFTIIALCYGFSVAQDDNGSAAPAAVSNAKRIAALRRPVGKAAKVTTTTTAAPPANDDADYNEEGNGNGGHDGEHDQYGDEGDEVHGGGSSTTTTTTEAPKKVGPVIRPFRSNDDFLNSLKRRQQNAKKHQAEKVTSKPNKKIDSDSLSEHDEDASAHAAAPPAAPAPSKSSGYKGNAALNRRKLAKPGKAVEPVVDDAAAEESEQQQKEETKPKRPLSARLALRKRN